jgi:hypothetical protein
MLSRGGSDKEFRHLLENRTGHRTAGIEEQLPTSSPERTQAMRRMGT